MKFSPAVCSLLSKASEVGAGPVELVWQVWQLPYQYFYFFFAAATAATPIFLLFLCCRHTKVLDRAPALFCDCIYQLLGNFPPYFAHMCQLHLFDSH